jgi:high-affinity nickel permease
MGKYHLRTLVISFDVLTFILSVKHGVSAKHFARFDQSVSRGP